jgi:hypothetical protein
MPQAHEIRDVVLARGNDMVRDWANMKAFAEESTAEESATDAVAGWTSRIKVTFDRSRLLRWGADQTRAVSMQTNFVQTPDHDTQVASHPVTNAARSIVK